MTLGGLRRGECRSTGGTSIDCVAAHMAAHRVKRAALITDGYVGRPQGIIQATLAKAQVGVALTPGSSTRKDLGGVADHWVVLNNREKAGQ